MLIKMEFPILECLHCGEELHCDNESINNIKKGGCLHLLIQVKDWGD
jgi:hypothetical protein